MNVLFSQLAVAIGGLLFVVVFVAGLILGVPVLTSAFRAIIVMSITSVIVAAFFHFFTSVLFKFMAEQVAHRSHDSTSERQNQSAGQDSHKLSEDNSTFNNQATE